jgi:hypothetical protein
MLNGKGKDTMKTGCKECYADNNRATPLLNPEDCLHHHRQYVCNSCGRCICADVDAKGRFRAKFPFMSLDVAILYLQAAEVVLQKPCEIYEIVNDKGRKEYKIFPSELELNDYLHNNKQKRRTSAQPLYVSPRYTACTSQQLRMLTKGEIEKYLKEHYSQYK